MVWEWNAWSWYTKDHGWVDFTVGEGFTVSAVKESSDVHCYHGRLLFFNIEELDNSIINQVLKTQLTNFDLLNVMLFKQ